MFLIIFTFIVGISCSNNNPVKSLTDPFNKIVNGFFDFVRVTEKVREYKNMTLSWKGLFEGLNIHRGFLVLLAVGLFYVAFVVISGLSFIICRCCGRCGSKPPAVDNSKATNKLAVFGVILLILILCQILSAFMIQSNNSVIYQELRSKDKEENWFQSFIIVLTNASQSLDDLIQKIMNYDKGAEYSNNVDKKIKMVMKSLKINLEDTVKPLYKTRDFNKLSSDAKVAKKTFEGLDKSFKDDQKNKYDDMRITFGELKSNITSVIGMLNKCNDKKCENILYLYKNLNVMKDNKMKGIFNKYYEFLSDDQIDKDLNVILNIKLRGDSIINQMISKIKQNLKKFSKTFPTKVKELVNKILTRPYKLLHNISSYLDPSTLEGSKTQRIVLQYDSYRFFGWLTIFLLVILISLMFFIGFLFGVLGKDDAGKIRCFKKIVGSRILMVGIGISFFVAPFLMVIVIVFMASLGSIQSEVCQYTVPDSKVGPAVLDSYLNTVIFNIDKRESWLDYEAMETLLVKCKNQNIYHIFRRLVRTFLGMSKQKYPDITKLLYDFNKTFDKYSKVEKMKNYVNELEKNIKADNDSYVKIIEYYKNLGVNDDMRFQKNELLRIYNELSTIINNINPLNTDLLKTKKAYQMLIGNLSDLKKNTAGNILKVMTKNINKLIGLLGKLMLKDLKCNDVREKLLSIFEFVCQDTLSYLNGSWYGLGLFLILLVPTVIVALFAEIFFRQLQDSYQSKDVEMVSKGNKITENEGNSNVDVSGIKSNTERNQLRDKAIKLKNFMQFKMKRSSKVGNKSDVENDKESKEMNTSKL